MKCYKAITLIVCLLATSDAVSGLTPWVGPSNVLAVVGQRVTMTCHPPRDFDSVDWYYTAFGRTEKRLINQGSTVLNGFREFVVSGKVPGQFLTATSVEMRHAGLYACTSLMTLGNGTGKLVEATAQLAVLETDPECGIKNLVVKESGFIELWCSVNFTGYWSPVMEWRQYRAMDTDRTGSVIKDGHSDTVVKDSTITSTARVMADVTRINSSYSCRTHFASPSTTVAVNATNVPNYTFIWVSSLVQVLYGPKEVMVSPRREVFHPGNVLTCTAKAIPSPELEWRNLNTGEVHRGPDLIIRDAMTDDQLYTFECRARNLVTGTEVASNLVRFSVKNRDSNVSVDMNQMLMVLVASGSAIIIAGLTIYIICLKMKGRASCNGRNILREDSIALTPTITDPIYSDYSEVPPYRVCSEAVARSNGRPPPPSNTIYLPMAQSTCSLRRVPAQMSNTCCALSTELAFQNNEYLGPDMDSVNPRYSVTGGLPFAGNQANVTPYANLTDRRQQTGNSINYTALEINDRKKSTAQERREQQKELSREPDDYLEPMSTNAVQR